ncbi:unnamed protein product [Urochloa decumbens]|uniref:Exocyst subunit Exo70 family protein n=1 Tax=Urochloa decumbens TaxID=240449 RepID=A0ABC9FGH8_9POAL
MAARADRIEALRRDLGWLPRRPNWSPPQPDLMIAYAYSGSTSAGTFSTTTYTSSRGSLAGELASQRGEVEDHEEKAKRRERAKGVLEGFCHGDGDIGALERWLSELGVGWVLGLADDAPSAAGTSLLRAQRNLTLTERWIWALTEITGSTVRFVGELDVPGPVRLIRFLPLHEKARKEKRRLVTFVEATILKMLPFVDALLAAGDPLDAAIADTADATNGTRTPSGSKLQILLDVRDAVSSASIGIDLCFQSWDSCFQSWDSWVEMETQRRSGEVLSLLSAKEQRLDEAIWNTMEKIRTSILNDDDDNRWGIHTPQGSSDTCKVTRSLITYIKSLWDDYWRVNHIVRTAAKLGNYVPERDTSSSLLSAEQDKTDPLTTLAMEMVSSLQVKLAKRSEPFPDHSLRLLFLINNTHFMWQHLHPLFRMKFHVAVLTTKIEDYIQKYLQVSWAPVLSCLYTRHYYFRTSSPNFDSEFQKTYTAQKLWKVPDPELRTRLREAIVEKVVSGLTRYLEGNNIISPGITPQEREEMLLELFEG